MRRIVGLALVFLALGQPVAAAPRPDPTCGWDSNRLWAENLPREWSMTASPFPTGTAPGPSSFERVYETPFTVWFWTRKGPGSGDYPKPGKQLNDYKIVCVA